MSEWYEIDTFDKTVLAKLKLYFDSEIWFKDRNREIPKWFHYLFQVAQHNVGVAHCINQHQSAINALTFYGHTPKSYAINVGCYSIHHDIDTININNGIMSGTKHWITSIERADFLVCKVGHYSDPNRKLVFVDLNQINYTLDDNNFNPIGLKIAKPMSMTVTDTRIPNEWILHQGNFKECDAHNSLMAFYKYGFITNFLGCATGLYHFVKEIVDSKNYNLQFELKKIESLLTLLKANWENNIISKTFQVRLGTEYWNWYDAQYNQTKQALSALLKIAIDIGSSRLYDSNSAYSQRFRDALVWNSHGKPPLEQLLMSKSVLTQENK